MRSRIAAQNWTSKETPTRARSSLCGHCCDVRDGALTTKPHDGGDTNSGPSEDLSGAGPSRNRLSNEGRGHDGASNPRRFQAEHAGRTGPGAFAQPMPTEHLQRYSSSLTPACCRETHLSG